MKKIISFVIFMTLTNIICFAQYQIKKVYGVTLGDSQHNVITILDSKGKQGTWTTLKSGKKRYKIHSVTLGECTFDYASFIFSEGKLCSVIISNEPNCGTMDTGMPAYSRFKSDVKRNENVFRVMAEALTEKYGSPTIQDDKMVMWKCNGNQITLVYCYEESDFGIGWKNGETWVDITYKISDISSSNY